MRVIALIGVAVVTAAGAVAEAASTNKTRADLPAHARLRINVTYRPEVCNELSKAGDTLAMDYVGTLYKDGSKFDSSLDRGKPFEFELGAGHVIKGWDQGLCGMCVGEKRQLIIPSALGYGEHGHLPKIPGGATLVFDVELKAILHPHPTSS